MTHRLLYRCAHRFIYEDRSVQAAGLAFYSLFALVPFVALILSLAGWVSIVPDQAARIEGFLLKNFVPHAAGTIEYYLHGFAVSSTKLPRISLFIFLLTSIFLINTIEACLNQIWNVSAEASYWRRAIHYTMVLIVAPVCLGLSISLSILLLSLGFLQHPLISSGVSEIVKLLPFVLTWLAVTTLYYWLPHLKINLKKVFIAGFIVAFLFELMKYGFQWYISFFPTYQIVYGAMALMLVFSLWVYLSWCAVLFGAILASEMHSH
ncbi:MAG: YhjD/YihY/BrkB family envelope integrity protein [Gammaproteobacteria bacterium]|jgi:membrane protein